MRVITSDFDTTILVSVVFARDSIVGVDGAQMRRAIPRDSVNAVEVRMDGTPHWIRIAWKVYLGVLAGLAIWLAIAASQLTPP